MMGVSPMNEKSTYEELEQRVKELEKAANDRTSLGKQLKLLSLAVAQSSEGITISDLDGKLEYVNNAFAQMHGYSPAEILNTNLSIFHTPDQIPSVEAASLELKKNGSFKGEIWHVKRDGTVFLTMMHNSLIRDDTGKPIGMMGTLRDTTDIKHTEEALRESEERFRAIFEAAQDFIFIKNCSLKYTHVNSAMEKLFQLSAQELIGKTDKELFSEEDGDHIRKVDSRVLAGEIIQEEHTSPVGETPITFNVIKVPIRDNSGEIVGLCGIARDITERKQSEEALRESEERFRSAFEDAATGIALMANDGYFMQVNQTLCKILGYSEEELLSKTWVEITEPDDLNGCFDWLKRVKAGEQSAYEKRFIHKLGQPVWVMVSSSVVRDSQDRIQYFISLFHDISSRKQAEKALLESEEKYRLLVESTDDWVWTCDIEDRQTFSNQAIKTILGYEAHEIVGLSYESLLHPEDQRKIRNWFKGAIENKIGWEKSVLRWQHRDGTIRFLESTAKPIFDVEGNLTGFTGIDRDVTKRKQAEEALKISKENLLAESNQRKILSKRLIDLLEKDRHDIAMELHDNIGQILTSLKIYLEIIDDKLKPDTELGSLTKTAIKRANLAINDLNNSSQRLMPGILDALGLVPSLRSLLNEFRELTDIKIGFFNRNVQKRFDREKELAIYRIVQEALNNIVKHAKAKNVYVSLLKKGAVLSLSVEDNGVGFDQNKAMKISKGKGPLGLVIMRERALQLDGELTIESILGKGTHLLVEIPI